MPTRHRNAAVGLWVRAGAWSANKLTDGLVPVEVLRAFGATPALTDALVDSTLWDRAADGAIQFTNWRRWQRTRDEVRAYRRSEAKRKQKARDAKKPPTTSDHADSSGRTNGGQSGRVRAEDGDPKTKERSVVVTLSGESPVGRESQTPPLEFSNHCTAHRHVAEPRRCHDCRRTREANEARAAAAADAATVAAAAARTEDLSRRARCKACDGIWKLDTWGDPVEPAVRCDHPGVS